MTNRPMISVARAFRNVAASALLAVLALAAPMDHRLGSRGYSQDVILSNAPDWHWNHGCTPTSAGMLLGYYTRMGYGNLFPLALYPGQVPLEYWDNCSDGQIVNSVIASTGHITDFYRYKPTPQSPWTPDFSFGDSSGSAGGANWSGDDAPTPWHQFNCLADFMGSSQDASGQSSGGTGQSNGGTAVWSNNDGSRLTLSEDANQANDVLCGINSYVRYASSYNLDQNLTYTQLTDNKNPNGFSFSDFKGQIDYGRPVLVHIPDHTMLAYGYNDNDPRNPIVYVHDTWTETGTPGATGAMSWSGAYGGLGQIWGVSVVTITGGSPFATWAFGGGGAFFDINNWLNGQLPVVGGIARFSHPGGYTVSFSGQSAAIGQAVIENGDVTFDLGGAAVHVQGLQTAAPVQFGRSATFTLKNGTLHEDGDLTVGESTGLDPPTSPGVTIANGANLYASTMTMYNRAIVTVDGGVLSAWSAAFFSTGTKSLVTVQNGGSATLVNIIMNNGEIDLLSGGLLVTGSMSGQGAYQNLAFANGTLRAMGSFSTQVPLTISSGGATIDTAGYNITLSGPVSGSAPLAKVGAGTLILTGGDSWVGPTGLNGGFVQAGSMSNLGYAALNFNGGGLQWAPGSNFDPSPNPYGMTFSGAATLDTNGNTVTLASPIGNGGAGSLTKIGDGALILLGANSYTGGTVISAGTLQLGSGGANGTLGAGPVTNITALVFNRNGTFAVSNNIGGPGTVTLAGPGTMVYTGADSIAGATIISAGTLQLGDGALSNGSVAGNITNNAALVFANPANQTYTGTISGTGSVTKVAAATEVFTGSNSYTGGTTVSAGTLQLGDGGSLNGSVAGDITDKAALVFANPLNQTYAGAIKGSGQVGKTGAAVEVLTGTNSYGGSTTISAGTLQVGSGGACGTLGSGPATNNAALVFNRSDLFTVANSIGGSGSVTQAGPGVLVFTVGNTYSGGTNISAGTLQIGNGATTGSISGNVADNGTLAFNLSAAATFGGSISGSGGVVKNLSNLLVLAGNNSYSGGTVVSAGTLQGNTNSLQGGIIDNALVVFNQTVDGCYAGSIYGTGLMNKTGPGTLALRGAVNIAMDVGAGRLIVNPGAVVYGNLSIEVAGRFENDGGDVHLGNLTNNGVFSASQLGSVYMASLTNYGTVLGGSQIGGVLVNMPQGDVRIAAGQQVSVQSMLSHSNAGLIEAIGNGNVNDGAAEFDCAGPLTNAAGTGLIAARNAILQFNGGLTNLGSLGISFGGAYISGPIVNSGNISIAGGASATSFYGTVQNSAGGLITTAGGTTTFLSDVVNNGQICTGQGSFTVFDGVLSGSGSFTGPGNVLIEDVLQLGPSGATSTFGGGLTMADASIDVLGGNQAVAAPVVLEGNLAVSVAVGSSLELTAGVSESVAGSALSLTGGGELVLSGSGSFTGGVDVVNGTLIVGNVYALADESILNVGNVGLFGAIAPSREKSAVADPLRGCPGSGLNGVRAVPEPGSLALLAAGAMLVALCQICRRPAKMSRSDGMMVTAGFNPRLVRRKNLLVA